MPKTAPLGILQPMSKEGKHHYIPIFYLKQWAGKDGRLCEYSNPYDRVRVRNVHPGGTGFVHGLYSVPGLPPDASQYVERTQMQHFDNEAAIALRALLDQKLGDPNLSWEVKIWWAAFLYGLVLRTPEYVAKLQERITKPFIADRIRLERDGTPSAKQPEIPLRAPIAAVEMLPEMFKSKELIQGINKMDWYTLHMSGQKHSLLTSDRPIIMSNGLARPTDFLIIPISPTTLFVAANSPKIEKRLKDMDIDKLVVAVNDRVAKQAVDYVYGIDNSHLLFVSRRLGKRLKSTPLG
ncbi:DUF4238 domain-containing protein [Bradyrhizobium sp. SZCCHNS3002]|uniref:DUF4238 domain-containing protein n=1 Tax=Bradyrhizobium sp. SZCCHNS3002 TaxID=3057310 RepID=UPI0028E64FED|nr:DUF4238 domain-containing protein [Bradyrhizobium sp. SZCCHNS3002]